jgi:hypothetical protein
MIREGQWTIRRAADFAGLTYREILDKMAKAGIDSGPTLKELREDVDRSWFIANSLPLTNDRAVAAIAKTHGIPVVWLTGALVEAVEKEIVSSEEARIVVRELVRAGLRVRSEVLAEVFHLLEERGTKKTAKVNHNCLVNPSQIRRPRHLHYKTKIMLRGWVP